MITNWFKGLLNVMSHPGNKNLKSTCGEKIPHFVELGYEIMPPPVTICRSQLPIKKESRFLQDSSLFYRFRPLVGHEICALFDTFITLLFLMF